MNNFNLLLCVDSYKTSHWLQYPPGTQKIYSYIESRGGDYAQTVFFGLQYILKEYLEGRRVTPYDIDKAEKFVLAHGEPFNRAGWDHIVKAHKGYLPLLIKAVPEGTIVPTKNVLVTIENTCEECYWLTSYVETMLMRVWYPTTVATKSWEAKQIIRAYLEETSDSLDGLPFKLHDFGARGVSSHESAMIGGAAHLVNFMGSDTMEGVWCANEYYGTEMAGFSIPAAEHSSITSWGKDHEIDACRNMLTQFASPGKLVAVVSDSYNIYEACEKIWGDALQDEVIKSGATVVIRPDSGKPAQVVLKCAQILAEKFGATLNGKGYKVINHVRIIQGDGINPDSIGEILQTLKQNGFSADNVAFGMGGALLQQMNRDTCSFAMKCSSAKVAGKWRDVYKEPVGDEGKKSKRGRLMLIKDESGFQTIPYDNAREDEDQLYPVFINGLMVNRTTLEQVRKRANSV